MVPPHVSFNALHICGTTIVGVEKAWVQGGTRHLSSLRRYTTTSKLLAGAVVR